MEPQKTKTSLRQQIRARLKSMTADDCAALSANAARLLEQQSTWKDAQFILFYAPLPEEPDIWRLLQDSLMAGKTVALPRFDSATQKYSACVIKNAEQDLQTGQFKIREPASHCALLPLNRLDLVLVPGVAFDLRGGRLGRGKGFYDQLLADVRGTKCGVAFDEQIVAKIPMEPHDIHLDCILTPTRWIEP